MSDHENSINKFVEVCASTEEQAKSFLEAHDWDSEAAIGAYFVATSTDLPSVPPSSVSKVTVPSKVRNEGPSGNVRSLRDIDNDDSDQDEAASRNEYYVGGSERGGGGQQVLGPKKRGLPDQPPEGLVDGVFKSAKEKGAVELERTRVDDLGTLVDKTKTAFAGAGYRLGEETDESTKRVGDSLVNGASATTGSSQTEVQVVVKMWQDGYNIDDGPLSKYDTPEGVAFLETMRRGEAPRELLKLGKGKPVGILLEDHHHEEYKAPVIKVKAFTGAGQMLGSPTPSISINTEVSNDSAIGYASLVAAAPTVDSNACVTQLQVRTSDGARLMIKLNDSHTIADLRRAILGQRPQLRHTNFTMMSTFPNKELKDESLTLKDANLLNCAIVLR